MKTAENFKKSAAENNITYWPIRNCSQCGYELGYMFNYEGYDVIFDRGCDCTIFPIKETRKWQDVADQYNLGARNKELLKKYNDFWKFEKSMSLIPQKIHCGYFVKLVYSDDIFKIEHVHWSRKHFRIFGQAKSFKWCEVEKWYKRIKESNNVD